MTPSVRTLQGSKIKSFKGSSSLCPRGSNSRGFSSIFYSVTGHTDELNTEIVIPADLNGCPVTTIGYRAFINCSELTSVTIQNNLTSIGDEAFYNCSGLTSVIIPNSMACIGSGAFYKCSGLNSVIIGDSVTSIGDNAFKDCSGLSSITIGNSLTSIGYSAFWGCSNLTSITIPSSVTSISSNAFANCSKLKNVKVVVTDYSELCNNNLVGRLNDEIYQLRIGTIQLIDHDGNEIREYSIPNGVTTINDNAFKSCKGLTSITIPNSVTSIGNSAFIKCSSLTSVTIGNSVTSIGENAFNGCSSLKRVTSCIYTPFAVNAFSNFNAALVVPKGSRDDYKNMSGWEFAFIFEEDEAIFELNQSDEQGIYYTLKADDNSVYYSVAGYYAGLNPEIVIPSELDGCPVKAVEANAFKGCTSLSSVTIPNTVTSIDRRAFQECINLATVLLGNQLETIGYYAFYGCTSLSAITIPNSVTDLGGYVFLGCSGLTSVTIGNGITSLYAGTFHGCSGLNSILIPNSVTMIADADDGYSPRDNMVADTKVKYGVFSGCSGLTAVTIGSNVTHIGNYAFQGCNGLTSITFPNSLSSIGDYAFNGCSSLISVELGNPIPVAITLNTFSNHTNAILNVPSGSGAAYLAADYWKEFKEIIAMDDIISFVDANVKAICVSKWDTNGDYELSYAEAAAVTSLGEAFRDNTSITSFNELRHFKSLISISENAFSGCCELASITFSKSVTSIGDYAFAECSKLTTVPFPECIISIGKFAFGGCTSLTSVTIPESVTVIGEDAFSGCTNLTTVEVNNPTPVVITNNTFSNCINAILYVPNERGTAYKEATYWKDFKEVAAWNDAISFADSYVKSICISKWDTNEDGKLSYAEAAAVTSLEGAFRQRPIHSFNELQYFKNLISIGSREFYLCGLSSITIPNSVTTIGDRAFEGCWKSRASLTPEGKATMTP